MIESVVTVAISLLGLTLGAVTKMRRRRAAATRERDLASSHRAGHVSLKSNVKPIDDLAPEGARVLQTFLVVVIVAIACTIALKWSYVISHPNDLLFYAWLILAMIGGMFAQVISRHLKAGIPLDRIKGADLVYPLFFSVVVFYPAWGIAAAGPHTFFAFYAAFLNGFFWETLVANTTLPPGTGRAA